MVIALDGGMRVGRDYQALIPPMVPVSNCSSGSPPQRRGAGTGVISAASVAKGDRKMDQYAERALLVWSPTTDIADAKRQCPCSFRRYWKQFILFFK